MSVPILPPVAVEPNGNGHAPERIERAAIRTQAPRPERIAPAPREGAAGDVTRPQQRMLDAMASFESLGLDELEQAHVAVLSGQSSRSSGFRNNVSSLNASGLIERLGGGRIRLTDTGRVIASAETAPTSLDALHEAWMEKLSGPQRLMLRLVLNAYPQGLDRDELASQSGQSHLSSGYRNNLSTLSALGLIRREGVAIVATKLLHPGGLS